MKQIIAIALLVILLASCKKEAVHKFDPLFIGTWSHQEDNNEFWYLDIDDKSYGSITLYDSSGNDLQVYGENPKRWRVNASKNLLYHSLFNKKFHIDKYPEIAQQTIMNGLDTIEPGKTYMILDGDFFVE